MAADMEKKWRRFEKLVARVEAQLIPNAIVTHDDHVWGYKSKKFRQIDVSIRQNIGQFPVLIVMSCKDHKTPIDIEEIDSFSSVIDDIHANKGAVVASNGFTEGAKNTAISRGIDLYTLIDAEEHEWQTYVSIPVICDFRSLNKFQFLLSDHFMNEDPRNIVLFNAKHQKIGSINEILHERWNANELPTEPGVHGWLPITNYRIKTLVRGTYLDTDILVKIQVKQMLYFGQLNIIDIKGFKDEITGKISTNEFTTDWLDIMRVENEWNQICDIRDIAVTPVITLTAIDQYKSP